jgi:putative ABC transport system permease protein
MLLQDLRYAGRLLRKTPLLTATIVLTMTLGIGAATAIFSVVNAVIIRQLPFADPDRLMWVAERNDSLNLQTFSASVLNYLSWKEQTHTFEALGAIGFASFNLTADKADPEQLTGGTLTPSVFPILGIQPLAGRAFRDGEDRPGAERVAMISEGLWRRRLGGDPSAIGSHVRLNGSPYEVVGVAPPALRLLSPGDVWVPLPIDPARMNRLNHVVTAIGRVKRGVTTAAAQAEMDQIAVRVGEQFPEVQKWGIRLVTFSNFIVGSQLRTSLWVLLAAVGCVLLIACANVANLLLSRAVAREREIATRTALGAGRPRLLRQLLLESLTLSVVGGAAGVIVAIWTVHAINIGLPQGLLPVPDVGVDLGVLAFACAVTVATGLLFGLAPAWLLARTDVNSVLKQTVRGATGGVRTWLRRGLAAAEVALATMLLVGAGLLGQTLVQLQRAQIGFRPDHLLTFQLSPPPSRYTLEAKAPVFYTTLLESLASLPGVSGAAVSSGIPFGNGNYTTTPTSTVGKSVLPADAAVPIDWRIVSPDFFRTMGIPLVRGRGFTNVDGPGTSLTIVSQATARRFWGDDDPIGRVLRRVADGREITVVGVVGDVRNFALNQDSPAMYYPSAARVWPRMDVVVRTAGEPSAILPAVRQRIRELDPDLPVSTVRTMDEWVSANAAQPRLNAVLLSIFSGVALVIAAVGVYGILAYSVNQRTREIGLRMALGAPRGRVLGLILGEGMMVGLAGIALGVGGALALGRALATLIYGVPLRDPITFTVVTATLLAVTLAASVLPARRASRIDPLVALRQE